MVDQRCTHRFAVTGEKLQHFPGDARLVHQCHGFMGDEWCLLRRFCHHRVARGKCRRHLAGEDGEGEIPRADAHEYAASVQRQFVALAGGARQACRCREILAAADRVVAAEIHRFAHFRDCVGYRLAGFAYRQRHQHRHVPFHEVRRAFQGQRAILRAAGVPGGRSAGGNRHGGLHQACVRRDDAAHLALAVGGIQYRLLVTFPCFAAHHGCGPPLALQGLAHICVQRCQFQRIADIDTTGIASFRLIDVRWRGDMRMGFGCQLTYFLQGVGDDVVHRRALVDDAIDEGGVGAVFEQSPYQVGQQIFVTAHRRVDAAGERLTVGCDDLFVERLAHAVQTLELVILTFARHLHDGCQGMGVVGGELGEEGVPVGENAPRAGDVGHVRRRLAREHGVAVVPAFLGELYFRVPVGALGEPQHQTPAVAPRQLREPVDGRVGALLIGLQRKPEALPAFQRVIGKHLLDNVEGKLQTLGFLRIHGEADVHLPGMDGQCHQSRYQLRQGAFALREFVAWMQGGELHRYAGRIDGPRPALCLPMAAMAP